MNAPNKKAPGWQAEGLQERKTNDLDSTGMSTAGEAQRLRILAALRIGPQTSYDLRRLGCYQAPARIIELRRAGYDIRTERISLWDRDGYEHTNCARYHLEGEPQP